MRKNPNKQTNKNKTGNVACVFNVSTQEADTGRSKFKTSLVHKWSSRARQWDSISNKQSKQKPGEVPLTHLTPQPLHKNDIRFLQQKLKSYKTIKFSFLPTVCVWGAYAGQRRVSDIFISVHLIFVLRQGLVRYSWLFWDLGSVEQAGSGTHGDCPHLPSKFWH